MKISHLRTKVILASLPILILGGVVLYSASNYLIQPGFQKIEDEAAINNSSRAIDALNNSVDQLDLKTSDWASWDDSYQFAQDQNKQFIKANLENVALSNLRIDYMLFFNTKNQLIQMKHINLDDPNLRSLPLDRGVKDLLTPDSPILHHATIDDAHSGVVKVPEGIIMLVSRPILNSQGEGPSRGSLVFGQYLDAKEQQNLADLTHLKVVYLPANDPSVSHSKPDYPSNTSKGAQWVSRLSDTQSRTYATAHDILGQPTITAQVDQTRTISIQGRSSIRTFLLFSFLAGLLIIITTAMLLNWLVVARIIGLSKRVVDLKDIQDSTKSVSVNGNDEVTRLGAAINDLLFRLHNTYSLKQTNVTLEQKVDERTKDLDEQLNRMKRTNELMIDRELRMQELKRQNAELRQKLGDEPSKQADSKS